MGQQRPREVGGPASLIKLHRRVFFAAIALGATSRAEHNKQRLPEHRFGERDGDLDDISRPGFGTGTIADSNTEMRYSSRCPVNLHHACALPESALVRALICEAEDPDPHAAFRGIAGNFILRPVQVRNAYGSSRAGKDRGHGQGRP